MKSNLKLCKISIWVSLETISATAKIPERRWMLCDNVRLGSLYVSERDVKIRS
jgi:hypothetical protein